MARMDARRYLYEHLDLLPLSRSVMVYVNKRFKIIRFVAIPSIDFSAYS